MSFYRYHREIPGEPRKQSSRIPLARPTGRDAYFCDMFYTSEREDDDGIFVYCVGHQRSWAGKNVRNRVSSASIFHYAVSGSGTFNDKRIHAGQFFFTYPYEMYSIDSDPDDPLEYYWFSFAGPQTNRLLKQCAFEGHQQIRNFTNPDRVVPMLEQVLYQSHPETDADLYLLGICYQILSHHKAMNLQMEAELQDSRDYIYYKDAIQYVNRSFNSGITPADVARQLHISPSYMRLIFQKYCEYSLREMLNYKRMEQAKSDLEFSNATVEQIALRAGYHDQSLFARLFRKSTGESPSEYRKHHKKQ